MQHVEGGVDLVVSGMVCVMRSSIYYGLLAAIVTLFLIPIIVVTFILQNQLLRGVTFGTVQR